MFAPIAALCVLISIQSIEGHDFVYKMKNVTCRTYNEELVKRLGCDFTKHRINNYVISLQLLFTRDLDRSFKAHFAIDLMPTNSRQIIHLINVRFNCCVFLQRSLENQLIRPLMIELKRVTNLPKQCPYKKDVLYQVKNFSLSEALIPTYLPTVNFNATLNLYDRNEIIVIIQFLGNIAQKK
ncbi:uncharacterized protein LOC101901684 [Musca domestica]|uniref:Uncharacterized protein LOC101901684 n=2 Tax=Musca domestica TaxID=7370 RepID=A0A9J7I876_MUSDO|nr:uncharacterized protein LOC101901684 [Musca domestica]